MANVGVGIMWEVASCTLWYILIEIIIHNGRDPWGDCIQLYHIKNLSRMSQSWHIIKSLDENLRKVSLHTSIISSLLDDLGNIWSRIDNNGMLSSWITLKEYCEQLHKATNLKREEASRWLNKKENQNYTEVVKNKAETEESDVNWE